MSTKWSLQLVSPNGSILDMGQLGYAARVQAHSYIEPEILEWLENSNLTNLEILKEDLWQGLLLRSLLDFHGYRLIWGGGEGQFSAYPNGKDLNWYLVRLINGKVETLLSGSLPDNWHDLDMDDRQWLVENR